LSGFAVEALAACYGLLTAVRGVSFAAETGDVVALVGANGAGKTTLLRTIAGAHPASAGRVRLAGRDITAAPGHRRVGMGIAMVPEGRRLFAEMTVEENLMLGRRARRDGNWTVERVLEVFPNLQPRRKALAGTLSGGEQQACAIGRALVANPDVLLLDEVSLGLSPLAVDRVYASLEALLRSGTTVVLVEQDLDRALGVANRVLCMLEGRIVLDAPAGEVTRAQVTEAYFGLKAPAAGGVAA
jgi:branched-chain amino acid transport system ATP-binding protein